MKVSHENNAIRAIVVEELIKDVSVSEVAKSQSRIGFLPSINSSAGRRQVERPANEIARYQDD